MTDTTSQVLTKGEYNDAMETLSDVFGDDDAGYLIELIQAVRDRETDHTTDNELNECTDDCVGCLAETIADAVTRAVNGKAA